MTTKTITDFFQQKEKAVQLKEILNFLESMEEIGHQEAVVLNWIKMTFGSLEQLENEIEVNDPVIVFRSYYCAHIKNLYSHIHSIDNESLIYKFIDFDGLANSLLKQSFKEVPNPFDLKNNLIIC